MEEVIPLGLRTRDCCVPVRYTHVELPPPPNLKVTVLQTEVRLVNLGPRDLLRRGKQKEITVPWCCHGELPG